MALSRPEPEPFELTGGSGQALRGESIGSGAEVILCHGLSATRRYVLHESRVLPRRGYRITTYDARGHGESDPGPDGYRYELLAADLDRVVGAVREAGADPGLILGGHSMGCHTVAAWALRNPEAIRALILIGPVYTGQEVDPELDRWDARADALADGGPEAFAEEVARGTTGDAHDTLFRLARDRARLHRNPRAVAEALREVPRSRPFGDLGDLAELDVPVLVVGSRDEIDSGHPLAAAESWAETIPGAELAVEDPGKSPLAWQGGLLSRAIDDFLRRELPGRR